MKQTGLIILFIGLIFGIIETQYFGYNLFPASNAELMCDIVSFITMTIGVVVLLRYKINNMSRLKVTYVAINADGGQPIMTAASFDELRKGLDDYYAVDRTAAKCLGFNIYNTKYPDSYEGYYEYEWISIIRDEKIIERDLIKVYCVDFWPETKEEL